MIKHYFLFFIRNLTRQKGYTLINIIGLSIGMAVSILILLYVFNELSYDKNIGNVDNKYRINSIFEYSGDRFEVERTCGELAPRSVEDIPEVVSAVALYDAFPFVKYEDKIFQENNGDVFYAHPSVFDFFSIRLINGNPDKVFEEPMSIVLSETNAKKYFGDENPIGKVLTVNDRHQLKVTGVMEDYTNNSHRKFGMLAPMEAFLKMEGIPDLTAYGNSCITYIEMIPEANQPAVIEKLVTTSYSFVPPQLIEQLDVSMNHYLQPIKKIHLFTRFGDFGEKPTGGRIVYVYIFSAIAIFILLLACVNFMNLATARYANRAKEVGVRKIVGAERKILIRQFLGESLFISFISLCTAVVLAELFLPVFNNLIGKELDLIYSNNWGVIVGLIVLGIFVGMISGSYPAFFLTSFNPLDVIKGSLRGGSSGRRIRTFLVVFQFIIALILITSTLVIYMQMNYVRKKDLGFNKDHMVVVRLRGSEIQQKSQLFADALDQIPGIKSHSFSSDRPGISTSWHMVYDFEGKEGEQSPAFAAVDIDENFIETVGLELTDGRNFSREFSTDSTAMLINQATADYAGWDEPVGKAIWEMNEEFEKVKFHVVGVIKDFHMESLHRRIEPLMFKFATRKRYCLVRIHPQNIDQTIASIESAWDKLSPSRPFNHHFLNDSYDQEYRSEQKLGKIFIWFAGFAIFIACLGMVGLVSFVTVSRTKEIGIRKVLGSKVGEIVGMITWDFVKMILISWIIASPVAYFIMKNWLERFAYKMDLSVWIFIFTGLIALLFTMVSITYQSVRAANKNPVEAIAYE